jgi:hypothetical protein
MGERDSSDQKSTDFDDLPPSKDNQGGVKGGAGGGKPIMKDACTSGLLSTCGVKDTTKVLCDTLSGCTTDRR